MQITESLCMTRSRLRKRRNTAYDSIQCHICTSHFRYPWPRSRLILLNQFKMILLLAFFAAFGMVVNGQMSECDTLSANLTKCKNDYPVTGTTALTRSQIMDFYKLPTNTACADKFPDLLDCVVKAYRNCVNENLKSLVVEPTTYRDALKKICDNKDDYNGDCITATYSGCSTALPANLTVPTSSTSDEDMKNFYCTMIDQAIGCTEISTDLSNCNKTKTKMILKEILTDLKPQACSGGSSGGTTTTILATSLLVVSFLSAMFF